MARVRLTNDSLNSYGSRILTAGVDITQYEKNPVLLYMHERGQVIGYIKDIEKTDDEITGELVFDEASELSKQCKQQYEFGSIRMVSVGVDVIESSAEPQYLLPGQQYATITKSKLYEVSLVDIGANDDAIRLRRNGELLTMSDAGAVLALPTIKTNTMDEKTLKMSEVAEKLGLKTDATEEQVFERIETMRKECDMALEALNKANEKLLANAVDKAISEKRIEESKREHFVNLGKEVGIDMLNQTLEAIALPHASVIASIEHTDNQVTASWDELDRQGKLAELKASNPEEYKRLFNEKFGK